MFGLGMFTFWEMITDTSIKSNSIEVVLGIWYWVLV